MSSWTFVVPLTPVAKGRPIAVRRGAHIGVITPTKTREWEATVAQYAAAAMPGTPLEGPLAVDILAVMPRPQSMLGKKWPDGLFWAPKRPDGDNIRKAVLDGMQARWRDDGQVVAGDTLKVYAERTGSARLVVRVTVLDPMGGPQLEVALEPGTPAEVA